MTAFGSFGSDPIGQALDQALQGGLERVMELGLGFETDQAYDATFFRKMAVEKSIFTLTSNKSKTVYGFIVRPDIQVAEGATTVQVVHVMTDSKIINQEHYRMLTLGRGEGGRIIARTGWRD